MAESPADLAARLAEDCIAVQNETGNQRLFVEVAKVIGTSSQTLEEAFMTAVRARMAEQAGRSFLREKIQDHRDRNPRRNADGSEQRPVGHVEILPPEKGD